MEKNKVNRGCLNWDCVNNVRHGWIGEHPVAPFTYSARTAFVVPGQYCEECGHPIAEEVEVVEE